MYANTFAEQTSLLMINRICNQKHPGIHKSAYVIIQILVETNGKNHYDIDIQSYYSQLI